MVVPLVLFVCLFVFQPCFALFFLEFGQSIAENSANWCRANKRLKNHAFISHSLTDFSFLDSPLLVLEAYVLLFFLFQNISLALHEIIGTFFYLTIFNISQIIFLVFLLIFISVNTDHNVKPVTITFLGKCDYNEYKS